MEQNVQFHDFDIKKHLRREAPVPEVIKTLFYRIEKNAVCVLNGQRFCGKTSETSGSAGSLYIMRGLSSFAWIRNIDQRFIVHNSDAGPGFAPGNEMQERVF